MPAAVDLSDSCPYPGLRSFNFDEDDVFFGREAAAEHLAGRLRERKFLAIVGPSGSGKTSLVRAGLLSAFERMLSTPRHPLIIINFSPHRGKPLQSLAAALFRAVNKEFEEEAIASLQVGLATGALSISSYFASVNMPPETNVLLAVDQMEDVLAAGDDDEQIKTFIDIVLACLRGTSIHAVLTIQSERLGDFAEWPSLAGAVSDNLFLVPRLTTEQLRAAIEGPLSVRGGTAEPTLVMKLIEDSANTQDRLPLMQHALTRLWKAAKIREMERAPILTFADYYTIGGSTQAAL